MESTHTRVWGERRSGWESNLNFHDFKPFPERELTTPIKINIQIMKKFLNTMLCSKLRQQFINSKYILAQARSLGLAQALAGAGSWIDGAVESKRLGRQWRALWLGSALKKPRRSLLLLGAVPAVLSHQILWASPPATCCQNAAWLPWGRTQLPALDASCRITGYVQVVAFKKQARLLKKQMILKCRIY